MRVVLSQLIILALLLWFLATFTVGPLPADKLCLRSHPRVSLYFENDQRTGDTFNYNLTVICDQYRPPPPPDNTPAVPFGWVPWEP